MKVGKPKSKRVPVRLRQKIEKASAAKQRKQRKLAKQNPEWRSRLKKDPGIPNLFPLKEKLLHEIEENKRRKEEQNQRRREAAKARREGNGVEVGEDLVMEEEHGGEEDLMDYAEYSDEEDNGTASGDSANPMAALLASARARAAEYDNEGLPEDAGDDEEEDEWSGLEEGNDTRTKSSQAARRDTSRHAYDKTFKEVLAASDIVLYVLDARDPEGTRSRTIEREIAANPDKRLLFILNKIDLIPQDTLRQWLVHLRQSFPTLPLRTTSPSSGSGVTYTFTHANLTSQSTAAALLKALKTWATGRGQSLKRAISVGVCGYPNVGKSSVINAILGLHARDKKTACPVGAEAGVTTAMRTVKLDSRLTLLDSPGIVFPSSSTAATPTEPVSKPHNSSLEHARLVLLNAIPPREIEDPIPAVSLILHRLSTSPERMDALQKLYGVPALLATEGQDLTTDFLVQVARRRGRLGKGGVPNLHSAGMVVVSDWRDGKIQGWVEPPKTVVANDVKMAGDSSGGAAEETAEEGGVRVLDQKVVSGWAEEFKLDGLWG